MTTADLLSDLNRRGVELLVNGDKLRIQPRDRVTDADVEVIRQHKVVLLKILRSEAQDVAPVPIIPGREHFSLWVDDPLGPLSEFIPGRHFDIRQPSRLRGMFSPPRKDSDK